MWILYVAILLGSVILHELGHLLASLYFKVPVSAFSIGFGPVLLHKKIGKIDWRLSLLPLGGYCEIEESLTVMNSLTNIAYWKQCIILMAGVAMNLSIAFVCYLIHYGSILKGIYIDYSMCAYFFTGAISYVRVENFNIILFYTAFLNSTLFVFNMLPIPALDGGYLWILPLRRKMSDRFYKYLIGISFWALMIAQVAIIAVWFISAYGNKIPVNMILLLSIDFVYITLLAKTMNYVEERRLK